MLTRTRNLRGLVTFGDLEDLEPIDPFVLNETMMQIVGMAEHHRQEIFNRLINFQVAESAIDMQAKTLARNPEPKGSMISFRHHRDGDLSGHLGQIHESSNGDVAIEIDGEFRVMAGNTSVKVWRREEKSKEEVSSVCGHLIGDHMAYGRLICDQPRLHTSAHEQSNLPEQCTKTRDGIQCAYNEGHSGHDKNGHNFSKKLSALRGQKKDSWTKYQAEFLWIRKDRYIGRTIVLPQIGAEVPIRGELTDVWNVRGANGLDRIFMVIGGKVHAVPKDAEIKVVPQSAQKCPGNWTHAWDPRGGHFSCEKIAGHVGQCGRR